MFIAFFSLSFFILKTKHKKDYDREYNFFLEFPQNRRDGEKKNNNMEILIEILRNLYRIELLAVLLMSNGAMTVRSQQLPV